MTKPFRLGFVLGRFQHVTSGHEYIFNKALGVCEKLIIIVGSEQLSGLPRNPFTSDLRKNLINTIYSENPNVFVESMPDLTHENDHSHDWGRFVLEHVSKISDKYKIKQSPDLMIYGNDEERQGWFDPNDIEHVSQLVMTRGNINISATKIREYLMTNNFWQWRQYTNEKIHDQFEELRDFLLKTKSGDEQ